MKTGWFSCQSKTFVSAGEYLARRLLGPSGERPPRRRTSGPAGEHGASRPTPMPEDEAAFTRTIERHPVYKISPSFSALAFAMQRAPPSSTAALSASVRRSNIADVVSLSSPADFIRMPQSSRPEARLTGVWHAFCLPVRIQPTLAPVRSVVAVLLMGASSSCQGEMR